MDEMNGRLDSLIHIDHAERVRIILEDPPEGRGSEPITVDIVLRERPDGPERHLANIRIIHEDELGQMMDVHNRRFVVEENDPMSYGEALTLLIALGVLIYLIYALLWPERF